MFSVTDIKTAQSYFLEPSRRGSSKLHAYLMPALTRELDARIPYAKVPLYIRRAAREIYPDRRGLHGDHQS